jgi:hypothetical protein
MMFHMNRGKPSAYSRMLSLPGTVLPRIAPHLALIVAGHVELIAPVPIKVKEDRGVLEARGVRGDDLLRPALAAAAEEKQAGLVGGRNQLQDAVTVYVARGKKPAELVVEPGDNSALRWPGVRIETLNLDLPPRDRLDGDIELIAAIPVDIIDQDLFGMANSEICDRNGAFPIGGHVAHDAARLRRTV